MKRPGARRRAQWRIAKIGWKDAKRKIEKEGYVLLRLEDGHAELLAPPGEADGRRHRFKTGGEAYYYLTKRSLVLLDGDSP